jgi:hypothetical protein
MEPVILRGEPAKLAKLYGYGYGYGYGDGSGDGYGYGSGDGDGYGSSSGSGYGYGSGDDYGDGDGYGYGSGDGDGYGSGSGDGDGDGDGYGSGSGDGDGSKEYWAATIPHFAAKWPAEQQARYAELQSTGATIAFWRSDAKGKACNGGRNQPVEPGHVETVSGPLKICSNALHATLIPPRWKGERWWIVALIGEIQESDDKLAALQREIIGEAM